MADDLVARLRKIAGHELDHVAAEAADELERLQRQVDLLNAHPPLLLDAAGTVTPLLAASDDEIEALEEENARLRAVLQGAVEVIKTWHNMSRIGLRGDPTLEAVWDIYWRNAPEMKPIREALTAAETTCEHEWISDHRARLACPKCGELK